MAELIALEEFGALEEEETAAAAAATESQQYSEGESGASQLEEDESLYDSSAPVVADIDTSQFGSDDSIFDQSEPAALDTTDDSIDVNSGQQTTRAFLEESSELGRASQDMSTSMAQISRKHVDDIAAIEKTQVNDAQTPAADRRINPDPNLSDRSLSSVDTSSNSFINDDDDVSELNTTSSWSDASDLLNPAGGGTNLELQPTETFERVHDRIFGNIAPIQPLQISAGEAGASQRAATVQSQGSRAELGLSTVSAKYDRMANISNAKELAAMPEHAGKSKEQLLRLGKQKRETDLRKIEQYQGRRDRVRQDLMRENPHLKLPPTNEHMKQIYAREFAANPVAARAKYPNVVGPDTSKPVWNKDSNLVAAAGVERISAAKEVDNLTDYELHKQDNPDTQQTYADFTEQKERHARLGEGATDQDREQSDRRAAARKKVIERNPQFKLPSQVEHERELYLESVADVGLKATRKKYPNIDPTTAINSNRTVHPLTALKNDSTWHTTVGADPNLQRETLAERDLLDRQVEHMTDHQMFNATAKDPISYKDWRVLHTSPRLVQNLGENPIPRGEGASKTASVSKFVNNPEDYDYARYNSEPVKALRTRLRERNLRVGGNKPELVGRLLNHDKVTGYTYSDRISGQPPSQKLMPLNILSDPEVPGAAKLKRRRKNIPKKLPPVLQMEAITTPESSRVITPHLVQPGSSPHVITPTLAEDTQSRLLDTAHPKLQVVATDLPQTKKRVQFSDATDTAYEEQAVVRKTKKSKQTSRVRMELDEILSRPAAFAAPTSNAPIKTIAVRKGSRINLLPASEAVTTVPPPPTTPAAATRTRAALESTPILPDQFKAPKRRLSLSTRKSKKRSQQLSGDMELKTIDEERQTALEDVNSGAPQLLTVTPTPESRIKPFTPTGTPEQDMLQYTSSMFGTVPAEVDPTTGRVLDRHREAMGPNGERKSLRKLIGAAEDYPAESEYSAEAYSHIKHADIQMANISYQSAKASQNQQLSNFPGMAHHVSADPIHNATLQKFDASNYSPEMTEAQVQEHVLARNAIKGQWDVATSTPILGNKSENFGMSPLNVHKRVQNQSSMMESANSEPFGSRLSASSQSGLDLAVSTLSSGSDIQLGHNPHTVSSSNLDITGGGATPPLQSALPEEPIKPMSLLSNTDTSHGPIAPDQDYVVRPTNIVDKKGYGAMPNLIDGTQSVVHNVKGIKNTMQSDRPGSHDNSNALIALNAATVKPDVSHVPSEVIDMQDLNLQAMHRSTLTDEIDAATGYTGSHNVTDVPLLTSSILEDPSLLHSETIGSAGNSPLEQHMNTAEGSTTVFDRSFTPAVRKHVPSVLDPHVANHSLVNVAGTSDPVVLTKSIQNLGMNVGHTADANHSVVQSLTPSGSVVATPRIRTAERHFLDQQRGADASRVQNYHDKELRRLFQNDGYELPLESPSAVDIGRMDRMQSDAAFNTNLQIFHPVQTAEAPLNPASLNLPPLTHGELTELSNKVMGQNYPSANARLSDAKRLEHVSRPYLQQTETVGGHVYGPDNALYNYMKPTGVGYEHPIVAEQPGHADHAGAIARVNPTHTSRFIRHNDQTILNPNILPDITQDNIVIANRRAAFNNKYTTTPEIGYTDSSSSASSSNPGHLSTSFGESFGGGSDPGSLSTSFGGREIDLSTSRDFEREGVTLPVVPPTPSEPPTPGDPSDRTYVPGDLNSFNLSYGSSTYRPGSLTSLSSPAAMTSLDSFLAGATDGHRQLVQRPALPYMVDDFYFNDDLTVPLTPTITPDNVSDFNGIRSADVSSVEGLRRPPLNLANFNLEQNRIIKNQFEEWQRANPRPGVAVARQRQQFADEMTAHPNTSTEMSGSIQNWLHESLHDNPNPISDTGPRLSPPPTFQSLLREVPEDQVQTPYDSIDDTPPIGDTPTGSIEVRADIRDDSPVSEEEVSPRLPLIRGRSGAPRYGTFDGPIDISPIEPITDGTLNGTPGYGTPSTPSSYLGRRGQKRVRFSPNDSYAMQSDLSSEDVAVASTSRVNNSRTHRIFGRGDRSASYSSSEEFRDARPPRGSRQPPGKRRRPGRMTAPAPGGPGFQPDALPPSMIRKRANALSHPRDKRNAITPQVPPAGSRRNRPFTPITPFRARPFQPNGPSARRNAFRRLNSTPNPTPNSATPAPAGANPLTPNVSNISGSANAQPTVSGVGSRTLPSSTSQQQSSAVVPTGGASNSDMSMLLMMSMMQQGSRTGGASVGGGGGGSSRGGGYGNYRRGRGSRGGVVQDGGGSKKSRKESVPTNSSGKSITKLAEEKQSNLAEYLEMTGPSTQFMKSLNYGYNNKSNSAIQLLAQQQASQQHR